MLIRVDPSAPEPLGEQVAASVRRGLAEGTIATGARLPPARAVAEALGVNLHTVLRGYQQLRDEGLVELRRGRGATVIGANVIGRAQLVEAARRLAADARRLGVGEEELLALVRREASAG